jgi:hypothetical protein
MILRETPNAKSQGSRRTATECAEKAGTKAGGFVQNPDSARGQENPLSALI